MILSKFSIGGHREVIVRENVKNRQKPISTIVQSANKVEIRKTGASQPFNHPQKGSNIRAEPIRSPKDINHIKRMLADSPRDLALFTLGINTNLRASDLLSIKIGQVRHLQVGEHFSIRERKTGKQRSVTINRTVHTIIVSLLQTMADADDEGYLFQSRKGGGRLTVSYLSQMVKGWSRDINLRGNYSAHTLRKTWGYMMRTVHNIDIPTLMTIYNHSTQRQTLLYLCIQPSEIRNCYMQEV